MYRKLRYGYAFRRIRLSRGKYAIVDVGEYKRLSQYKWHVLKGQRTFYASRRVQVEGGGRQRAVSMHREIIKAKDGQCVDHINHNGLDNRKANLRLATRSQNAQNRRKPNNSSRSKYKGISFNKREKKWNARIQVDGKQKFLGFFRDEVEAAKAYDEAARKYHKEFAVVNFQKNK